MQQTENQHLAKSLEACARCFDGSKFEKHLLVSLGDKVHGAEWTDFLGCASTTACNHKCLVYRSSTYCRIWTIKQMYMALPARGSLAKHHCLIVPMRHVEGSLQLDENEWDEMKVRSNFMSVAARCLLAWNAIFVHNAASSTPVLAGETDGVYSRLVGCAPDPI